MKGQEYVRINAYGKGRVPDIPKRLNDDPFSVETRVKIAQPIVDPHLIYQEPQTPRDALMLKEEGQPDTLSL